MKSLGGVNVAGVLVLLGWVVGAVAYVLLPREVRMLGTVAVLLLYYGAVALLVLRVLSREEGSGGTLGPR